MLAILACLASSKNLKEGSHIIESPDTETYTIPNTSVSYAFIKYDTESDSNTISILNSQTPDTLLGGSKSKVVQYTLFKLPEKYVFGYNYFNKVSYTIPKETTVILIYTKPVTCHIEGSGLLTTSNPEELPLQTGTDTNSDFLGSKFIAIRTSSNTATITFKNTNDIPTQRSTLLNNIDLTESTGSYSTTTTIAANHLGIYNSDGTTTLTVNTKSGYSVQCVSCTVNSDQVSAKDNNKIVFLVVKQQISKLVITNGGVKYLWDTYNTDRYYPGNDLQVTLVSDAPISLKFQKIEGVILKFGNSFDNSELTQINLNDGTVYGQIIHLFISGSGLILCTIVGSTSLPSSVESLGFSPFIKLNGDCLFIQQFGIIPANVPSETSTTIIIPSDGISYIYSETSLQQSNKTLHAKIETPGPYNIITVNKSETTIVQGNPDALFETKQTKKVLFISSPTSTPFSSRSLLEETSVPKYLHYYSSSSATIKMIPATSSQNPNEHKIENALAVYIEENNQNQNAIGFYDSKGYLSVQNQEIFGNFNSGDKKYSNPTIPYNNMENQAEENKLITIVSNPSKKNIVLLSDKDKFKMRDGKNPLSNLIELTGITTIKPTSNATYRIILLNPNVERVSAIINPKKYTRKIVVKGKNAIIVGSSSNQLSFDFPPNSGITYSNINSDNNTYKLITVDSQNDQYIDFIKGDDNSTQIYNLDNNMPALEDYKPEWNPISDFNYQLLLPGRYYFKLSSSERRIKIQLNTIAFFVPKSMNDDIQINVINTIENSKNYKKFNIFSQKLLGYYFDALLDVELSGNTDLEIYIYSMSYKPQNMSQIVFKRGGKQITASEYGFVGFTNYSFCTIGTNSLQFMSYENKQITNQFTTGPFFFRGSNTVSYTLISSGADNHQEEEFTIPNEKAGYSISSSDQHSKDGEEIKYQPDSGLTKNQIAGIIAAIIIFIIIDVVIVALVCYCRKHEPKKEYNFEEEDFLEGELGPEEDAVDGEQKGEAEAESQGEPQAEQNIPEDAPEE